MLSPLLPCYSLDYLSWQLLNQPFLFYIFFSFHPNLPRFPHGVYNYFAISCVFRLSSALPDPILVPVPVTLVPVPISATVLASVPVPVRVPIRCSSSGPHPRPRPCSRPALLRSPPPPLPFPLRPCLHDRSRPRYRLRSHL